MLKSLADWAYIEPDCFDDMFQRLYFETKVNSLTDDKKE